MSFTENYKGADLILFCSVALKCEHFSIYICFFSKKKKKRDVNTPLTTAVSHTGSSGCCSHVTIEINNSALTAFSLNFHNLNTRIFFLKDLSFSLKLLKMFMKVSYIYKAFCFKKKIVFSSSY